MNRMEPEYPIQDIRNAYLVGLGVKPASTISRLFVGEAIEVLPQYLTALARIFRAAGVKEYEVSLSPNAKAKARMNPRDPVLFHFDCFLGKDQACLNNLVQAHRKHDDRALGEAYGFPPSAIDAYCSNSVCAGDIWKQLIDGRNAGQTIPTWYSYISHVPTRMNLISGDICTESKDLGTMYRRAIQQARPNLIPLIDPNAKAKTPLRYHEANGEIEYYFA